VRIAVLSDIHGNLGALEAVIADLKQVAPDLVVHGGDLADSGSSPREVVDRIRELGCPGVMGNTDEMLIRPESLEAFAAGSAAPTQLWEKVREIAAATRCALGEERLGWIGSLPGLFRLDGVAVVHASPGNCWVAAGESATDAEIEAIYGGLGEPVVVFGHTHRPRIRVSTGPVGLLVNSGSVGMPYDGNPRASYAVVKEGKAWIRRVEYDVEDEIRRLRAADLPGAAWMEKVLRASGPQMP
jgi:predicted phosphodiesterase